MTDAKTARLRAEVLAALETGHRETCGDDWPTPCAPINCQFANAAVALDAYVARAEIVVRASMPCYRIFASGLGKREEAADDATMQRFCSKPGYRACSSCSARTALAAAEAEE